MFVIRLNLVNLNDFKVPRQLVRLQTRMKKTVSENIENIQKLVEGQKSILHLPSL